MITDSGH